MESLLYLTKGSGRISLFSLVMHERKFAVGRRALSFYLPLLSQTQRELRPRSGLRTRYTQSGEAP